MALDDLQTWPGPEDESPFRRPLVGHPGWTSPHIRRFDGDARFVVRLVPALQLVSSPDLLATTMALHAELESFGIPVPPRMYLVGSRHRNGSPQAFIVARGDQPRLSHLPTKLLTGFTKGRRMGMKLEDLIAAAERQGWVVDPTKSGFMFRPADRSQSPYTVHRDPPDHTLLKKILPQLRKRGLIYPPPKGTP